MYKVVIHNSHVSHSPQYLSQLLTFRRAQIFDQRQTVTLTFHDHIRELICTWNLFLTDLKKQWSTSSFKR